jgi:hypothetical protein
MIHPIWRFVSAYLWRSSTSSLFIIICLLFPQVSPATGNVGLPAAASRPKAAVAPVPQAEGPSTGQASLNESKPAAGMPADIPVLDPGKKIERELTGEDAHSYRLNLAAGQYVQVGVDQRRINLMISVFDSRNNKVAEGDLYVMGATEKISFVTEAAGGYRVEVKSPPVKTPVKGQYEIGITKSRPAVPPGKQRLCIRCP